MTVQLSTAETHRRLAVALPELAGVAWQASAGLAGQGLPAWVGAQGEARTEDAIWVLLEPAADGPEGMAQAVLDMPPGRYLVEIYDTAREAWISRESALAPPLVIGVPRRAGAIVLRITLSQTPSPSP